jgi:WD40 repeat protein
MNGRNLLKAVLPLTALLSACSFMGNQIRTTGENVCAVRARKVATLRGHRSSEFEIRGLAFSPDGGHLASCGFLDGNVCVWNMETFRLVARAKTPMYHVHCVAWSPDGSRIAAGGRLFFCGEAEENHQRFRGRITENRSVDGTTICAGAVVWNWPSMEEVLLTGDQDAPGGIRHLAFTPESDALVFEAQGNIYAAGLGGEKGSFRTLLVCDLFSPPSFCPWDLGISAGLNSVVLVGAYRKGGIEEMPHLGFCEVSLQEDSARGPRVFPSPMERDGERMPTLGLSSDGRLAVTALPKVYSRKEGHICIWHLPEGTMQQSIGIEDHGPWSALFSSDDRYVFFSEDTYIYALNLRTEALSKPLGGFWSGRHSFVDAMAVSPDGRYLATSDQNRIYIWELSFPDD